jgi:hypothetical protein
MTRAANDNYPCLCLRGMFETSSDAMLALVGWAMVS